MGLPSAIADGASGFIRNKKEKESAKEIETQMKRIADENKQVLELTR